MPTRVLVRWIVAVAGLALGLAGCTKDDGGGVGGGGPNAATPPRPIQRTAAGVPVVRVKLLAGVSSVKLGSMADPSLRVNDSKAATLALAGRSVDVSLTAGGWSLSGAGVARGALEVTPGPAALMVNGAPYRGKIRLVPAAAEGKFDVINEVDVDDYLKSVISRELYKDWQPETYRAQAIVARTYALYEVATAPQGGNWDVYPDTRSQVYGGISAETPKSIDAVVSTRGIVVTAGPFNHEQIFKTYFSACCGGVGQSAADAFGDPPLEALSEKHPGGLCSESPRYTWGPVLLTKAEVTRRFRIWGKSRNRPEASIGDVRRIVPTYQNRFGRPVRFEVIDARGQRYSLTSEELRWALNGAGEFKTALSSYLTIVDTGGGFAISGHGSGHGVGMCQYCAEALAKQGRRHEDIVRYSYPGSRLVKAY